MHRELKRILKDFDAGDLSEAGLAAHLEVWTDKRMYLLDRPDWIQPTCHDLTGEPCCSCCYGFGSHTCCKCGN